MDKPKVLSLYKQIFKASNKMPTPNRRDFVRIRTRMEFKENKGLTDQQEIQQAITYAELQLETIEIQSAHLSDLATGYQVNLPEGVEDPHAHKKLKTTYDRDEEERKFRETIARFL